MEQKKNWNGHYDATFDELKGKTLKEITGGVGDDTMTFICQNGETFQLHYYPDCCASCSVEDICGELSDLIDCEILLAVEVASRGPDDMLLGNRKVAYEKAKAEFTPKYAGQTFYYYGPNPNNNWQEESETWVFYKLSTIKGTVTIRWYGSSNGYYSESATFERVK